MNTAKPSDSNLVFARPGPATIMFDHEKLHVYQSLLRFITWVTPLIEEEEEDENEEEQR